MLRQPGQEARASLRVRLLSMVYEALLLAALWLVATAFFAAVVGDSRLQPWRTLLQLYLVAVTCIYFVWSWTGGRRTLPMRTWRLRLVNRAGEPPSVRTALLRFLIALLALPLGAAAAWWALVDRERLFLHDRIAGTRLMRERAQSA
jgi:uncharacterized RDD family membrane protein YckC